ncbi:hypothetical protein [Chryseobacterium taihuense]|uniref:Uncharacterized protein n=1 Tax=Chryseobacterium taihuense TaxID=1141221 RepID=A0ABY0R350_9FLAO|nr:hypothetical protein [Chryseobacterium taihuense]SDM33978.1 hypothetical protein SAMN05216273_12411 [Chryseobacterium taihuense]
MKKHLFLRLCLMFLVGVSAFSCRTEDFHNEEEAHGSTQFRLTTQRISLSEAKHKAKLLTELKEAEGKFKAFSKANAQGRIINYANGVSIDTDQVTYIENGPNFHTYTFHLTRQNVLPTDPVENLVLFPTTDGTYKELLVSYALSVTEKETLKNGGFVDTKGKMSITELAAGTYNPLSKGMTACGWQEENTFVTVCSENQHGMWNTESWGSCSADRKPGWHTTMVYRCDFIYTGNETGGTDWWSGPGGGTDNGGGGEPCPTCPTDPTQQPCNGNGVSTGLIDPNTNIGEGGCAGIPTVVEMPDNKRPCDILKDNDNIPKIKNKIDSLRNLVTKTPADTTETMVTIKKSFENYIANVSNQQNSVGVGTIGAVGEMSDLDVADIHNHPPQNNMPIFSFNDLLSFYDSYTYVKPSRKSVYTSYLVNFNGTTYALRMSDVSALDILFAGLNIGTANATAANKETARKEIKDLYKKYGYKDTETYNQVQSEKIFLKVLNDPKFGGGNSIQVYRKDGDKWGKLKIDNNGTVSKDDCP